MDAVIQTHSQTHLMNSISSKLRPALPFSSFNRIIYSFCTHSGFCNLTHSQTPTKSTRRTSGSRVVSSVSRSSSSVKAPDAALLKENWLDSLSCPVPQRFSSLHNEDSGRNNAGFDWMIGIDPDLCGALAVLKTDESGCSAQVFDTPHLPVLVGKRVRRRLDTKSIIQLIRSLDAPLGTTVYIEQSIPCPQDGKQGWWSGGFGYGLWIGVLVASGFSVVPVSSMMWKNQFQLYGGGSTKDDSRRVASTLFPSLSSQMTRKKDHGRAEALLIAAYGKGLKNSTPSLLLEEVTQ